MDNPLVGDSPDIDPDPQGGTPDPGQITDQPNEPPRNYLEVDDVADRYVRVKVDGQDIEVPLGEALAGYSRTADYTRKTQALAEAARANEYAIAVQRALQAQPAETLRVLASQYNVNFDNQQSPPPTQQSWEQPSSDDGYLSNDLYSDPEADRLAAIQRRLDEMDYTLQRRQADEAVAREVGALKAKYQLDDAAVQYTISAALQAGFGPGQLEVVYKNLAFDWAQQARAQAEAQRQQQDGERRAASQNAQQLISSGSGANSAGAPMNNGASDGHMSIREAFDAAVNEHGGLPSL